MLTAAAGDFDNNPVLYINLLLRKHFHLTKQELDQLSDYEWAEYFAILTDIRNEESKANQPFA